MDDPVELTIAEAEALCRRAAGRAGASEAAAASIARAAVFAEASGTPALGLAHFIGDLNALSAGRIDSRAEPRLTRPTPVLFHSDAGGGVAHLGFDLSFEPLVDAARTYGVAVFAQSNAYTCGELGYFTRRLAEAGLVALGATNGPALLAGSGGHRPVYCTNPMSFAAPQQGAPPLVIDQASSETAFYNIRQAAAAGRPIPEGWAVDQTGRPTTDPTEAMKGALRAFGGAKGANIALMVEVLAAGLTGANWSLDAPSFREGTECPRTGLFLLAIAPDRFMAGFGQRLRAQIDRLKNDYGVYIPGLTKGAERDRAEARGVTVPRSVHDRIAAFGGPRSPDR